VVILSDLGMTRVESIHGYILAIALCHSPDPDGDGDGQAEAHCDDPAQRLGCRCRTGTDDGICGHLILLSSRDVASPFEGYEALRRGLIHRMDRPIEETGEIA
jgi:hypothetical protein